VAPRTFPFKGRGKPSVRRGGFALSEEGGEGRAAALVSCGGGSLDISPAGRGEVGLRLFLGEEGRTSNGLERRKKIFPAERRYMILSNLNIRKKIFNHKEE